MAAIAKKHRDKFIGGLITILLLGLSLWVKSLFADDTSGKIEVANQKQVVKIEAKDSAKVENQNNQLSQDNKGVGKVENDFSQNKKVIVHPPEKAKTKPGGNSNSSKVDIKGNDNKVDQRQWNIDGDNNINGDVIVGKPPREFGLRDQQILTENLKKLFDLNGFTSDSKVDVSSVMGNAESYQFAQKVYDFLERLGYKMIGGGVTQSVYKEPFTHVKIYPENDIARVDVGVQK